MQIPLIPAIEKINAEESKAVSNLFQYEWEFHKAYTTFQHQIVFDPIQRKTVNLTPIQINNLPEMMTTVYIQSANEKVVDLPFLGSHLDKEIACGIADGLIDPCTKVLLYFLVAN